MGGYHLGCGFVHTTGGLFASRSQQMIYVMPSTCTCQYLYFKLLFLFLNVDYYQHGNFVYQKQAFNPNAVEVTALHLVSQIRCLCVGYSFGSFQLYSLCPTMVVCSSPIAQDVAITHFAYMEPENDPRSFVYLWVATGMSPLIEERYNNYYTIQTCTIMIELWRKLVLLPLSNTEMTIGYTSIILYKSQIRQSTNIILCAEFFLLLKYGSTTNMYMYLHMQCWL